MSSEEIQSTLEALRLTLKKLDDKFTVALANQNYRFDRFDRALQDQNCRLEFLERNNGKNCNINDPKDGARSFRGVNNGCPTDSTVVQNSTFERDEDNVESTESNGKSDDRFHFSCIVNIFGEFRAKSRCLASQNDILILINSGMKELKEIKD